MKSFIAFFAIFISFVTSTQTNTKDDPQSNTGNIFVNSANPFATNTINAASTQYGIANAIASITAKVTTGSGSGNSYVYTTTTPAGVKSTSSSNLNLNQGGSTTSSSTYAYATTSPGGKATTSTSNSASIINSLPPSLRSFYIR